MKNIRSSINYSWCTSFAIGKGATAVVYQGVHEGTGDLVAVKTFTCNNNVHDAQMREFEVMRGLSHKNVVKLLAVEEDIQSHEVVIVMELCNKGSLHNILEDPQNKYGLEEEEFLCVLKDVSTGMKYLRDNGISHRDLKPGNIMHHVSEDGRSIYKITDFGAAKYVPDDQEFSSVHGTPGYLHPDLYERAVSQQPMCKSFRATIDLWSIGVTFYHAATGSLPFQPFRGRTDYFTMHHITTKKASGVISGIQCEENGSIEWSKELPDTCLLSLDLRNLVTVLLAGILECSYEKMWTFDHFFEYTSDIISRRIFHIFYMNEGKEIRLYIQPNKMLQDFKDQIFALSKVPISRQLLFFDKHLFISQIKPLLSVSTFPSTTIDQPLILIHAENTSVENHIKCDIPGTPFIKNSVAYATKMCCNIAHVTKRLIVKIVRCQMCFLKIPEILLDLTEQSIRKLSLHSNVLQERIEDVNHRTDMLERSCSLLLKYVSTFPNIYGNELQRICRIISQQKNFKNQVIEKVTELQSSVHLLNDKFNSERLEIETWKKAVSACSSLGGCIERADTFVRRIYNSWQVFLEEERNGNVVNQKFHDLEKVKVAQNSKKLVHLKEECLKSCLRTSKKLVEWPSNMWVDLMKSCHFCKDLISATEELKNYSASLKKVESEVCEMSERIVLLKNKEKSSQIFKVLEQNNKDFREIIEVQNGLMKKLERFSVLCAYDMGNCNKEE